MTDSIIVNFVGKAPRQATHGDAGYDLEAAEDMYVKAGEYEFISTDTRIALPYGYHGKVVSRSGLARKHGIHVLNSPGIIDSGYRGHVGVTLKNDGPEGFIVKTGDRIAQLLVEQHVEVAWQAQEDLDDTARGHGGFGSTGITTEAMVE